MTKHILTWLFTSLGIFLLGLPITLLGPLMVALALPFRIVHHETDTPFTDPSTVPGTHRLVTLPGWARLWDNIFDGAEGDKRGWWNTYCLKNYKLSARSFYSMWQWLAIRNPDNYWSRVITGCDVSRCDITLLAGQPNVDEGHPGWHFLCATDRETGRQYHYLGFVFFPYADKTHYILGRFGWKIKLSHNGTSPEADPTDRFKGSVFRVSFWKSV